MRFCNLGFGVLTALSLSACGGGYILDAPVIRSSIVPEVGTVATREVGDPLFYNETMGTYEALTFVPGQKKRLGVIEYEFREPFIKGRVGKNSDYYCGTLYRVRFQEVLPACFTQDNLKKENIPFQIGQVTRSEPGNFRRELVYQGRVGNELRLSYREFSGEMARPAFTQELTFEFNGGAVIGAKGARLEVIEATNTTIKYRVLQGFN